MGCDRDVNAKNDDGGNSNVAITNDLKKDKEAKINEFSPILQEQVQLQPSSSSLLPLSPSNNTIDVAVSTTTSSENNHSTTSISDLTNNSSKSSKSLQKSNNMDISNPKINSAKQLSLNSFFDSISKTSPSATFTHRHTGVSSFSSLSSIHNSSNCFIAHKYKDAVSTCSISSHHSNKKIGLKNHHKKHSDNDSTNHCTTTTTQFLQERLASFTSHCSDGESVSFLPHNGYDQNESRNDNNNESNSNDTFKRILIAQQLRKEAYQRAITNAEVAAKRDIISDDIISISTERNYNKSERDDPLTKKRLLPLQQSCSNNKCIIPSSSDLNSDLATTTIARHETYYEIPRSLWEEDEEIQDDWRRSNQRRHVFKNSLYKSTSIIFVICLFALVITSGVILITTESREDGDAGSKSNDRASVLIGHTSNNNNEQIHNSEEATSFVRSNIPSMAPKQNQNDMTPLLIPYAPQNLDKHCSDALLSPNNDQRAACQKECMVAACCVLTETMPENCFKGETKNACLTYRPCETIYPVYGMLINKDTVNASNGAISWMAAALGNTNGNDSNTNKQQHMIASACDYQSLSTSEGRDSCDLLCSPAAACCFETKEGNADYACWNHIDQDYYLLCYIYSPCAIIYTGFQEDTNSVTSSQEKVKASGGASDVTIIQSIVDDSCNKLLLTDGALNEETNHRICRDLCLPASCCFMDNYSPYSQEEQNNSNKHGTIDKNEEEDTSPLCENQAPLCSYYASCKILYFDTKSSNNTSAKDKAGANYKIANSISNVITRPINKSEEQNEFIDKISAIISGSCAPELNGAGNTTDPGHNTASLTVDSFVATAPLHEDCSKICYPSLCCFDPDPKINCWDYNETKNLCDVFQPCYILNYHHVVKEETTPPGLLETEQEELLPLANNSIETMRYIVDLACDDDSLLHSNGWELCTALCRDNAQQCCDGGDNCNDKTEEKAGVLCQAYGSCHKLHQRS